MVLDRIANILQHACQLNKEHLLLVGVSGGPDSLCLMHALYQLNYRITAVHVNHRLRPEADRESEQIKHFAYDLGVDFIACQVDVRSYAKDISVSIEEAARTLRYTALFEKARESAASAVVVGHNADDQVETILTHMLRGSGLAGLLGMEIRTLPNAWSDVIPLVRPLLAIWREEIQGYIDNFHLTPIFDSSNLDISYLRNRVRHELLPVLQSYNPSISKVILRMGRSLKDDFTILEEMTSEAWDSILVNHKKGCLAFRIAEFNQLPISIQRLTIRRAIAYFLPGLRDVNFACIERGLALLAGHKSRSQTDLVAQLRLIKDGDIFWIADRQTDIFGTEYPLLMPGEKIMLPIPSVNCLNEDWQLVVEEISNPGLSGQWNEAIKDPYQAWLDIRYLEYPLIARARQPGDRIKPLGMNGHSIKISDLMINHKLPKAVRDRWPIICSGREVIWIPGLRVSDNARVKPGTSRVLHLSILRDRAT